MNGYALEQSRKVEGDALIWKIRVTRKLLYQTYSGQFADILGTDSQPAKPVRNAAQSAHLQEQGLTISRQRHFRKMDRMPANYSRLLCFAAVCCALLRNVIGGRTERKEDA